MNQDNFRKIFTLSFFVSNIKIEFEVDSGSAVTLINFKLKPTHVAYYNKLFCYCILFTSTGYCWLFEVTVHSKNINKTLR